MWELAITVAVVVTAAAFLAWRWTRAARQALSPTRPAPCGSCTSCDAVAEIRKQLATKPSPDCDARPREPATHRGGP